MLGVSNRAWLIWILGAMFFLMDYFIRISPSVITGQLMSSFHVGAFALGGLSAVFYYAYVTMQIPVGAIFDRYGVRVPLISAISVCTVGVFLFAIAGNIELLYFSRFLMGFAGAFSFVGALKIIHIFFPSRFFAMLTGATQALGMIGAAFGDAPMAKLMESYGWRHVTIALGVIFLVLLVGIIIFARGKKVAASGVRVGRNTEHINIWQGLGGVIRRAQTWVNSLYIGFLYAPTAAFAGLWGVPYFTIYHHESTALAAAQVGMIFIGLAIGCPITGWFSSFTGKRLPTMRASAVLSFVLIIILIFGDHTYLFKDLSTFTIFTLMFLYGFFNSGIIPSYALATEINDIGSGGMALGFTNMASLIIGALLLPGIGKVLDFAWSGKTFRGHPVYSIHSYQLSLIILPVCFIIAFAATFFVRETYCKHK